jgi:hypothetical protein
VTFKEAATVFGDPLALTFLDPDHSEDEDRELTFGQSANQDYIVVAHMRAEYGDRDLGPGVRGKHYEGYLKSHNVVVLEPEVAEAFPTDKAVNDALKSLIEVAQRSTEHVDNQ